MTEQPKKIREFTTKLHYAECSNCGPIIGKAVDWKYVRSGGQCLGCATMLGDGRPLGMLKEIKLTQEEFDEQQKALKEALKKGKK